LAKNVKASISERTRYLKIRGYLYLTKQTKAKEKWYSEIPQTCYQTRLLYKTATRQYIQKKEIHHTKY
jgi:hypothetical protein